MCTSHPKDVSCSFVNISSVTRGASPENFTVSHFLPSLGWPPECSAGEHFNLQLHTPGDPQSVQLGNTSTYSCTLLVTSRVFSWGTLQLTVAHSWWPPECSAGEHFNLQLHTPGDPQSVQLGNTSTYSCTLLVTPRVFSWGTLQPTVARSWWPPECSAEEHLTYSCTLPVTPREFSWGTLQQQVFLCCLHRL